MFSKTATTVASTLVSILRCLALYTSTLEASITAPPCHLIQSQSRKSIARVSKLLNDFFQTSKTSLPFPNHPPNLVQKNITLPPQLPLPIRPSRARLSHRLAEPLPLLDLFCTLLPRLLDRPPPCFGFLFPRCGLRVLFGERLVFGLTLARLALSSLLLLGWRRGRGRGACHEVLAVGVRLGGG